MNDLRFAFGKNWQRYLKRSGRKELEAAKGSLSIALEGVDPSRSSFLDIGSGSGLFSRAAYELGFSRILSFDFDPDSVAATLFMKQAAGAADDDWQVLQGSVLDNDFMMNVVGTHHFVYSWGVLHHTGALWKALDNAAAAVNPGGVLFIAIYNDQGWISRYWRLVKRTYVRAPGFVRLFMLLVFWAYFGFSLFVADVLRLRNPLRRWAGDGRGMRFFTDVIDWVGGYPFEVAAPDEVKAHLGRQGFSLTWEHLVGRRHGCNEFVFRRGTADE